jgi:hypothetical protein
MVETIISRAWLIAQIGPRLPREVTGGGNPNEPWWVPLIEIVLFIVVLIIVVYGAALLGWLILNGIRLILKGIWTVIISIFRAFK